VLAASVASPQEVIKIPIAKNRKVVLIKFFMIRFYKYDLTIVFNSS